MVGLYIHVPFCIRKCSYCDFYSVKWNETSAQKYADSVICEADGYSGRGICADTVYFGGGTPSLLPPDTVRRILDSLKQAFVISDNAEITLEANPSSLDSAKLEGYRKAGVNRLSIGVQSSLDNELKALGRLHDFKKAKVCVESARRAGFKNISVDMMIAIEGQTVELLDKSSDGILSLAPDHISCYILKLEEGTPLYLKKPSLPDDEQTAKLYLRLSKKLESEGFAHYEISNFAKLGFESRHNLKYWRGEEYIGLGPAAHSYFGGKRYYNKRDISAYLNGDDIRITEEQTVDRAEEYLALSLRLSEGVSIKKYISLGGDTAINEKLKFIPEQYIKADGKRISLTDEGFLVSNEIIATLL